MRFAVAAGTTAAPLATSSHEPMLIGEVTLKTRSMFRNRCGLPRSRVNRTGLIEIAPSAVAHARRASGSLPAHDAAQPSADEAPPRPPKKKYHGISGFQTGGLITGRP
jgi:hypothetical protein